MAAHRSDEDLLALAPERPALFFVHIADSSYLVSRPRALDLIQSLQRFQAFSPLLTVFLDGAVGAILTEASHVSFQLPPASPNPLQTLDTFFSVKTPLPVRYAAAVALQLAHYIIIGSRIHPRLTDPGSRASGVGGSIISGEGFGLVVAAAIAASSSLVNIVKNGVAMTRLAFCIASKSLQLCSSVSGAGGESFCKHDHARLLVHGCDSLEDISKLLDDYRAIQGDDEDATIPLALVGACSADVHLIEGQASILVRFRAHLKETRAWKAILERDQIPRHTDAHLIQNIIDSHGSFLPKGPLAIPLLSNSGHTLDTIADFDLARFLATALSSTPERMDLVFEAIPGIASRVQDPTCSTDLVECLTFSSSPSSIPRHLERTGLRVTSQDATKLLLEASFFTDLDEKNVGLSRVDSRNEIAIIGYSCRLPGANDPEEFWDLLQKKKDMHTEIPERLFDVDLYHNNQYRITNTMKVRHGNFLEEPGLFDRHLFNFARAEAEQTDPQHRNALLAAYEALEMSGTVITPRSKEAARVGVFIGGAGDDYRENLSCDIQEHFIVGNSRQLVTTNISRFFGFGGPSQTYDTACSGSMVAIEAACNNILSGKCKTAIAGGVSVLTQPQSFIGLDRGYFLTRTGQCKTFDDGGDGYSRADAIGMIVFKSLSDALADGDKVLGVISAIGTNHSGTSHSITHPHAPTQARLFKANCVSSEMSPLQVNVIEMHGTGTQAGDANEISSVLSFARGRDVKDPVIVGSVKANLGHSEAASGSVALIKALLMLRHRKIPAHIGIKEKINTKFPSLDGIHIPREGLDFPFPEGRTVRICCNNFSATGGNSNIMLREAVEMAESEGAQAKDEGTHTICLSAASSKSLNDACARLVKFINDNPTVALSDIAYTASARRPTHLAHRLAVTATSRPDLLNKLTSPEVAFIKHDREKIAFVFSGQGSQYVNMGRELYEAIPQFRANMIKCESTLKSLGFDGFLEAIYPQEDPASQPSPYHYQLAVFSIEYSLAQLWIALGFTPAVVVGHSLGEYAALAVARVLSLLDAIYLVASRVRLIIDLCTAGASGMLACQVPHERMGEVIASDSRFTRCEIACINSPTDTVIAGPTETIHELNAYIKQEKLGKSMVVDVPYAFHSASVQPVVVPFKLVAKKVELNAPQIPVISNVLGRTVNVGEAAFDAAYFPRHLREPVRFSEGLCSFLSDEAAAKLHWVEIGPHSTSSPMVKACLSAIRPPTTPIVAPSMRKGVSALETLQSTLKQLYLAGHNIRWSAIYENRGFEIAYLPFYAFDYETYWIDYIDRNLSYKLAEKPKKSIKSKKAPKKTTKVKKAGTSGRPTPFALLSRCTTEPGQGVAEYYIDLQKEPARSIIEGHLVHGVGLLPASMYSDIALQAGQHVARQTSGSKSVMDGLCMEVASLSMDHPIILDNSEPSQCLFLRAEGSPLDGDMTCTLYSVDSPTGDKARRSQCIVRTHPADSIRDAWLRIGGLVRGRFDEIKARPASRINRGFAYKLFEKVVSYSDLYHGMQQVHLAEDGLEAAIDVQFSAKALTSARSFGEFVVHPVFQDSMGQCTGFLPNIKADDDHVYIANGCGTVKYLPEMWKADANPEGRMSVYCSTEETNGLAISDTYFFNEQGNIIGMMGDVQFRKMKRSVMERLMLKVHAPAVPAGRRVPAAVPSPIIANPAPITTTAPIRPKIQNIPHPTAQTTLSSPSFTHNSSQLTELRSIIVQELGVADEELTPDAPLADLGLDSLMALMILGNYREKCPEPDVPSTLFMEYPTMNAVASFFYDSASSDSSVTLTPLSGTFSLSSAASSMPCTPK
ncbi:hypothetical protein BOTBODRAFT_154206 [Botryobasidium botryosum FD-172 SS1]|uniref:Uncharacterized protein n=1 Tax=Botryobasidium botryosum (strain FD-172 SS1) TaxID=930990 RepID=A0A067N3J4_BOTB1|nr:hypothetical protein BOTBODRAFT_154206 [Botryobasidium botryosum FD-172 SS1]